jgi:hypothetical protein
MIAHQVEPEFGDETLRRLAQGSGVDYHLLSQCRDTYRVRKGVAS